MKKVLKDWKEQGWFEMRLRGCPVIWDLEGNRPLELSAAERLLA
jgi:hypothetical protein